MKIDMNDRRTPRLVRAVLLASLVALPVLVLAAPVSVTIPNTFSSGTTISSSQVNANFSALASGFNSLGTNVGDLSGLTTSNKSSIVGAINEVRQGVVGPQGPQGVQGPAGPTLLYVPGFSLNGATGGGVNDWTSGFILATAAQFAHASSLVSGKPFTAAIRLQTVNATTGGDNPGPAITGGNLVADLRWVFTGGGPIVEVVQSSVTTFAVSGSANNNLAANISGTVPAAPNTPGGFQTSLLVQVRLTVNATSTATGQSHTAFAMQITP